LQLIITEFESAELLAESIATAVPDIVLISVDGRETFQTAKNFRMLCNDCHLVIISNSQQFGIEAYNIQVADYIIKPVGYGQICKALKRCEMLI
jgi:two-component SAPR family response regulator